VGEGRRDPRRLEVLAGRPGRDDLGQLAGAAGVERAEAIVDALLGTGFEGEPQGAVSEAIEVVNAAPGRVVSVDVPSGVDASTGVVAGAAVQADLTVTFHAAKPGLWIRPGKDYAGDVMTIDPVSTANPGWTTFLDTYNQFCSDRGGIPLLNQTPRLTRAQVQKALAHGSIAHTTEAVPGLPKCGTQADEIGAVSPR